MATISEIRRTKNELAAQRRNSAVVRQVSKLAPGDIADELPLEFTCECSDLSCDAKVQMQIGDYQALTRDPARFIVSPGHNQADIEKVLEHTKSHSVVEKRQDLIRRATS